MGRKGPENVPQPTPKIHLFFCSILHSSVLNPDSQTATLNKMALFSRFSITASSLPAPEFTGY